MNSTTPSTEYLLLLRGNAFKQTCSPQELQDAMGRFAGWFDRLTREGKLKAGQPLGDTGKLVTGKGRAVADGPYAESKEAVAGYILLAVDSMEEAVALAEEIPMLDYGVTVEVRPITAMCAAMEAANINLVPVGV
jgi:hypothetical protein